jgi:hypothetical protein
MTKDKAALLVAAADAQMILATLFEDLEMGLRRIDGDSKGKVVLEVAIEDKDGLTTMTVTGKLKLPDVAAKERKLSWVEGQLELYPKADQ